MLLHDTPLLWVGCMAQDSSINAVAHLTALDANVKWHVARIGDIIGMNHQHVVSVEELLPGLWMPQPGRHPPPDSPSAEPALHRTSPPTPQQLPAAPAAGRPATQILTFAKCMDLLQMRCPKA